MQLQQQQQQVLAFLKSWRVVSGLPGAFYSICCLGVSTSCRTATLDFFFDLTESKVAVFLCSILTSDGVPFCFGKNLFP